MLTFLYILNQNRNMKPQLILLVIIFIAHNLLAQNVGIGTTTPAEKLDVNGNVNLNGQLKISGNAGTANQMLMKDAANNLIWGNLNEFKNLVTFDCFNIASTAGTNNCSQGWNVPAGVTAIFVECWGGGGGGGTLTGGGGGGYISARLDVTPLAASTISIGAGGNFGTVSTSGILGGNTTFSIGSVTLTAYGGSGGIWGDLFGSPTNGQAGGGGFAVSGITTNYLGFNGSPGGVSKLTFSQAGASDYAKIVNYGDGGDAGNAINSGGKGGYKVASASINQVIYASQYSIQQGGGGGADPSAGFYGRGGRVIIHW